MLQDWSQCSYCAWLPSVAQTCPMMFYLYIETITLQADSRVRTNTVGTWFIMPQVHELRDPYSFLFSRFALLPGGPVPSAPASATNSWTFVHIQLLENQLKKASAEERKSGIDLSGLRAQIKKEIAEVDRRL